MHSAPADTVQSLSASPDRIAAESAPIRSACDAETTATAYQWHSPRQRTPGPVQAEPLCSMDESSQLVNEMTERTCFMIIKNACDPLGAIESFLRVLVGDWWTAELLAVDVTHGSVTDMPNILPGGRVSYVLPVSFDAKRIAIASSTACWRFSATCSLHRWCRFHYYDYYYYCCYDMIIIIVVIMIIDCNEIKRNDSISCMQNANAGSMFDCDGGLSHLFWLAGKPVIGMHTNWHRFLSTPQYRKDTIRISEKPPLNTRSQAV